MRPRPVNVYIVIEFSDGKKYLAVPKDDVDKQEAKDLRLIAAEVVMNMHKIK